MKQTIFRAAIPVISVIMIISCLLTGCGSEVELASGNASVFSDEISRLPSQEIAKNDRFSLEWDDSNAVIILRQYASDKIWSTVPYEYFLSSELNEDLYSPISISYVNNSTKLSDSEKGYAGSVKDGRFESSLIENGIEVIYYFDTVGISVPVQYYLRNDSMAISVDFSRITEGENKLLSVSVAPFLCSVANNTEDSYLVIPSGSGGLIYPDVRAEGTRTYSAEIYGTDRARIVPEDLQEDENIRIPIFGVKDKESGLLAIVEEGAEAALIQAEAGSNISGYTNAYVTFYARGYDLYETQVTWAYQDLCRVAETHRSEASTIAFYPLNGDDSDYIGMAECYRQYLTVNKGLEKSNNDGIYAVSLMGGAQIKTSVLGIPVLKTKSLTTFKQAENIVDELNSEIGIAPVVQLTGYGESGLTPGKVGGGFEFADVFGTAKEHLSLEEKCKDLKTTLFTDFELSYFRTTGAGFSSLLDVAKSASMHNTEQFYKSKSLRHYDKNEITYYLLTRGKLDKAITKLIAAVSKKGISGVSLSSLGNTAYSDYSDEQYYGRKNIASDVAESFKKLKDQGIPIATSGANDYSAVAADCIFDTPLGNGNYNSLDECIPLYQMTFKGYKPLYSQSINTAADQKREVMLAVQSGTALGYLLVGQYNMDFAETPFVDINTSDYISNRASVVETVSELKKYYKAIANETIASYELLGDGLTLTEFSNGIRVYANHSNSSVYSPAGELERNEFAIEWGN